MLLHVVSRIKSGCGYFRRIGRWRYHDACHGAPVGCNGNCHGTCHGHGHGTCRVHAMADGNAWARRSNSWLVVPTHGKLRGLSWQPTGGIATHHGLLSSLSWHSTTKYDNVHPWRQRNESERICLAYTG